MSKKINLTQLKNFRGTLMVIENEVEGAEGKKEKQIIPATIKDSIEGFLIFLNMSFRTAMTMEDWKILNRINNKILNCKDNVLIIDDSEHEWLKKKLEAVPPQSALQQGASTVDSYGGLAFGADVIPILEALDNLVKE